MIILAPLFLSIIVGLLRGGSLLSLAQVRFRYGGLILLAVVIQRLIYTSWWESVSVLARWTTCVYSLSMLLLVVAVGLNYALPGLIVLGAGLLLNSIAVWSNGGHMPASLWALQTAGFLPAETDVTAWQLNNSILMNEGTHLGFLCDILALPKSWPMPNVFSVGDVLIVVGGIIFTQSVLVPPSRTPA